METPSQSMRQLALELLAKSHSAADSESQEAALVNEKLRISIIQFAGAEGFSVLLRRALVLASAEVPALKNATVNADGQLEGLDPLVRQPGSVARAATVAITAHLLGLLVTFIGEPLTYAWYAKVGPTYRRA